MNTSPPRWGERAKNLAATMLAVAVMLYVAARLIEAVLPVLLVLAGVVVIGLVAGSIYQFRRSRW